MKIKLIVIIFIITAQMYPDAINQSYIQVYGEGTLGQYLNGFKTSRYSKEDAVLFAKSEIIEFLSGMLYGYTFNYKVKTDSIILKDILRLNQSHRLKVTTRI